MPIAIIRKWGVGVANLADQPIRGRVDSVTSVAPFWLLACEIDVNRLQFSVSC